MAFLASSIGIARAVPRAEAPFAIRLPVVDGSLDDPAWAAARPLRFWSAVESRFDGDTEARILWARDGVYIAFRAVDRTPAFGHCKVGEPVYLEDAFEVFIDQMGDHRQWYEVQASPAGQVFCKTYVLTGRPRVTREGRLEQAFVDRQLWRYDEKLPADFRISSRLDRKTGIWTLEMFLPASMVNRRRGGAPMSPCTWRLNLARHDWDLPKDAPQRKCRFLYWAPVLDGHPHISPLRMGYLTLEPAKP